MNDMNGKIAFLFPGQGAQFVGMGKDLYEMVPSAKCLYDQADDLLGYSIKKLCFEGPEETLTKTCYAQPAIFVTSLAALAYLKEKHPEIQPSLTAGLSLGEFTALVACGSISFESGLNLVRKRAEAMEKSATNHPGTMASILGLSLELCSQVASEAGCEVANINSPTQIALSGTNDSIQRACLLAESKGAKRAIVLKVAGAFHSALMEDAKGELETALRETPINEPHCLFVPNVLAEPVAEPEMIRLLLAKQLTNSVRWSQTMQKVDDLQMRFALEVGPGKVLKGLAKQCSSKCSVIAAGTFEDIQKLEERMNSTVVKE